MRFYIFILIYCAIIIFIKYLIECCKENVYTNPVHHVTVWYIVLGSPTPLQSKITYHLYFKINLT